MNPRKARFWTEGQAFLDNFIIVSPARPTNWKSPPFFFLVDFCMALRAHRPEQELVLMGHSKGAWWGSIFLAVRLDVFHAAVLVGGYSTPKRQGIQRSRVAHLRLAPQARQAQAWQEW